VTVNGVAPSTAVAIGQIDPGLGPIAGLIGGKAAVGHGLVGVRFAQPAVSGAVEVAVAAAKQVKLGVPQCRVAVAVYVAVLVAQKPQPSTVNSSIIALHHTLASSSQHYQPICKHWPCITDFKIPVYTVDDISLLVCCP